MGGGVALGGVGQKVRLTEGMTPSAIPGTAESWEQPGPGWEWGAGRFHSGWHLLTLTNPHLLSLLLPPQEARNHR